MREALEPRGISKVSWVRFKWARYLWNTTSLLLQGFALCSAALPG